MKTEQELRDSNFTNEGIKRFEQTMESYSKNLFETSIALAKREHSDSVEITQTHVRDAAISLIRKSPRNVWSIIGQTLEYVFGITAGIGAGNMSNSWGQLLFGGSIFVGTVIFVVRNIKEGV